MMHRRQVLVLLAAGGARVCGAPPAAHAQPSAEQVLSDMHLSAGDRQRVLGGEFVTADVPAVSDRDLSFAIAFLVKTSPDALGKQVMSGNLVTADAQVQSWGELKGAGSLADFARLKITSEEARATMASFNVSVCWSGRTTAANGATWIAGPIARRGAQRTVSLNRLTNWIFRS